MSFKARTIDNLGVDSSFRYAKDKELLDPALIEESKFVPFQTEVMVTSPYVPSDFDDLFSTERGNEPWADFFAPPDYASTRKKLFSYQLIPSMGTPEKQLEELDRLRKYALPSKMKKKKNQTGLSLDEREEEREKDSLISLLETIAALDKQLLFVNMRRNQYHKG